MDQAGLPESRGFLNSSEHQKYQQDSLKSRAPSPVPRVSPSTGLRWHPRLPFVTKLVMRRLPVWDPTLRITAVETTGLRAPATALSSRLSATSGKSLDLGFWACVPTSILHGAGFRAGPASLASA